MEVTIEANPEDITMEGLKDWYDLGINRISIGIQSFLSQDLSYMNRIHDADQSRQALEMITKSSFENVTADLMFGLVNSTIEDWQFNLNEMTRYDVKHLSVYNLTIEEQTVFANWKARKKLVEIADQSQEDQFNLASDFLTNRGFDHYEISNYAQPGYHAVHNTNYWKRANYLGFGPSAHSYVNEKRSWNIANNQAYMKSIEENTFTQSSELLDSYDIYNELVMLGLRTKWGISKNRITHLPTVIQDYFKIHLLDLLSKNILIEKEDHVLLNKDSWYLSDSVASELFITKD